jgi:hypothetical protein
MKNSEMKPGRYLKLHTARQKIAWIKARLAEKRTVQLNSGMSCIKITAKNVEMLKATKRGLHIDSKRGLESIAFHSLRAS